MIASVIIFTNCGVCNCFYFGVCNDFSTFVESFLSGIRLIFLEMQELNPFTVKF